MSASTTLIAKSARGARPSWIFPLCDQNPSGRADALAVREVAARPTASGRDVANHGPTRSRGRGCLGHRGLDGTGTQRELTGSTWPGRCPGFVHPTRRPTGDREWISCSCGTWVPWPSPRNAGAAMLTNSETRYTISVERLGIQGRVRHRPARRDAHVPRVSRS
jgi:hypothetical protein